MARLPEIHVWTNAGGRAEPTRLEFRREGLEPIVLFAIDEPGTSAASVGKVTSTVDCNGSPLTTIECFGRPIYHEEILEGADAT